MCPTGSSNLPTVGKRAPLVPAALLLLVACSVAPGPAAGPGKTAPRLLTSNDTTPRGWNVSDSAAIALGLTPLRHSALPAGDAEIRLWTGMGIGLPHRLLRLSRSDGQVTGFVAWYWPIRDLPRTGGPPRVPIDSVLRYSYSGRCEDFRRQGDAEGCIALLTHAPPWQVIWDSLTTLGVWTQPDQSELPRDGSIIGDGWSMAVELRDGDRYRSFAYSNPDAHPHPAQQRAAQIGQVGGEAWAAASLPPNRLRSYHGRLNVPYRRNQTFVPCGSNQIWGVQPEILEVARRAAETDSAVVRSYYVELRAMPVTPGLLEMWRSPFDEVLSVHGIVAVKPWSADACGTVGQ